MDASRVLRTVDGAVVPARAASAGIRAGVASASARLDGVSPAHAWAGVSARTHHIRGPHLTDLFAEKLFQNPRSHHRITEGLQKHGNSPKSVLCGSVEFCDSMVSSEVLK